MQFLELAALQMASDIAIRMSTNPFAVPIQQQTSRHSWLLAPEEPTRLTAHIDVISTNFPSAYLLVDELMVCDWNK